MKRLFQAAAGFLGLAASQAQALLPISQTQAILPGPADQILIYKYSSARPWTQYDCFHPDIASTPALPVIPKTARVGTYTQTEYWAFNKTQNTLQVVEYYTLAINGASVKKYQVHPVISMSRTAYDFNGVATTAPGVRYLPAVAANTFNVSVNRGGGDDGSSSGDVNGDGFDDVAGFTVQENLLGLGKAYTVAPGLVFQQVAASLQGPYSYSDRTDLTNGSAEIFSRSLYFETATTQSITLDAVSTKSANTGPDLIPYGGGTAVKKATLDYGVRLAELLLEKLGYDNADEPAGAVTVTAVKK
ncbi:MAG: hypothetical protein JWO94_2250 [Verrucomicrobiaceae bacterium]|nr:hypothetical protein [Verrucomicrobiaceae bacterium]